jgi:hypothetical protein
VQQPVEHGGSDGGVTKVSPHAPTPRLVVITIEVFK